MNTIWRGLVFSCSAAVLSCAPLSNERAPVTCPGMVKIYSAGKSFHQGWDDAQAAFDERPGMQTSFGYDYWLDTTEVTQQHYFNLTGKQPVPAGSPYGIGNNFPVYYVSWFDAVLFCNERSKAEGLDTIYAYCAKKEQPNGSVNELTGLCYDFSRDGYRLPTEAEWEFAAREASSSLPFSSKADSSNACYRSWHAENSSGTTHAAGTRLPNSLGLYDMAGNVFEWTNDWKRFYTGDPIANSLGAPQPDNEFEKIIKGGSFRHGLTFLRPSHRSATYATVLSSANEYVGFRCARGPIAQGHYIGIRQTALIPNHVTLAAGAQDLQSFIGGFKSKVVFVNVTGRNRTLCYADFSKAFPYMQEYLDDTVVYMPTISPDGRYVAYCSRNEGLTGPSKITVRSLDSLNSPMVKLRVDSAYIPRWWVNRTTGDTCIVYTNSAVINGNPLWRTTETFVQRMNGGSPAGALQELISDGSYHDGISSDGRYIVTSYDRLMMKDLSGGEEKQLFLPPNNGKSADGSQVCNASLSPDTAARVLFLDFGCPDQSTVTGCSYGIHQYLFMSSFSDSITDYLRCPAGEASWDYPEWSNQKSFAVSCCRNPAEQSRNVYAVAVTTHRVMLLANGVELQQPYLWIGGIVENPFDYALDSLGAYDDPPIEAGQNEFAYRMHYFWQRHNELDLVFFGSSIVGAGIDCAAFSRYKAFNLGFAGCEEMICFSNLTFNYIIPHAPQLKCIGMYVPFRHFYWGSAYSAWWLNSIAQSKGYCYDQNHNFWKDSLPAGFSEAMAQVPYPSWWEAIIDTIGMVGTGPWGCDGWGDSIPTLAGNVDWILDDSLHNEYFESFVRFVQSVSAHNIHLLVINFPESPHYRNTDHYFIEGPSWETGRAVLARLKELQQTYPYFHVYDAYNDGNHDYTDADAHDDNHLCRTGAAKLSARLETVIDSILSR